MCPLSLTNVHAHRIAFHERVLEKDPDVWEFVGVEGSLWREDGDEIGYIADVPVGLCLRDV